MQLDKQIKKESEAANTEYLTLKCKELEELDRGYNPLLFQKMKEMEIRKKHLMICIKDK